MNARLIDLLVTGVEVAAAAMFGGAVAYAVSAWLSLPLWYYQIPGGVFAFVTCLAAMRKVAAPKRRLRVPMFNVRDIEPEFDELFLTDADRIGSAELVLTDNDRMNGGELLLTETNRVSRPAPEPLMLDDILAELGPDSRVVRLFDRKAMPTPAELQTRIDRHLGRGKPPAPLSDDSQALSDALAELRRSLR